ncbi:uncharacterized protein LOC127054058 isoform X4 [Gopherus flavomarginatus]|uniref:uncharacterized protein LOC127054058 isoform X4 n=1 Tax=Gopherus flavomarginatus TaxID=286002 RepID=UPI0021CBB06B|nr:uncharacterized protein LOC127054058 isoform X4 [Gopherus flavomarginatus]
MGPPRWLARAACGRGVVTCHGSGPGFESCPRRLEGFLWASIVYCQCPGAGRLRLHPVARRAHARSKDARALSWQQTVHVTERVAGARWMRAVSAEQRAGPARDGSGRDDPGYRRSPSMSLFSPMNTPPSDELLEVRIIEKGAGQWDAAGVVPGGRSLRRPPGLPCLGAPGEKGQKKFCPLLRRNLSGELKMCFVRHHMLT